MNKADINSVDAAIEMRLGTGEAEHHFDQYNVGYAKGFKAGCKQAVQRMREHGFNEGDIYDIVVAMIEWNNAP